MTLLCSKSPRFTEDDDGDRKDRVIHYSLPKREGSMAHPNNNEFYDNARAFGPYLLFLLGLDFIFNWTIDWAHSYPLVTLVIFVFQCLGLVLSLILYILAAGNQALQTGLKKSLVYHHQLHLLTSILYISLTVSWYIWALRKSWPSVSDQFSFSFGYDDQGTLTTTMMPPTFTTLSPTNNASTLSSNVSTMMNQTTKTSKFVQTFSFVRKLFPTSAPLLSNGSHYDVQSDDHSKEFYTLWSPGFVALYTIQRTVAILYYFVALKAGFLVQNAHTIENLRSSEEQTTRQSTIESISGGVDEKERIKLGDDGSSSKGEQLLRRAERLRTVIIDSDDITTLHQKEISQKKKSVSEERRRRKR